MRIDLRLLSRLSARPRTTGAGGSEAIRRALRDEPWTDELPVVEPASGARVPGTQASCPRWSSLGFEPRPKRHVLINLLDPYPRVRLLPAWAALNTQAFRAGVDRLLSTQPARVSIVFDQRLPESWRAKSIDELPARVERIPLRWRYPLGCAALLASQLDASDVVDSIDLVEHEAMPVARVDAAVSYHMIAAGGSMRSVMSPGTRGFLGHPMRAIRLDDQAADRRGECVVWADSTTRHLSAARCTECGWCAELCPTACTPAKLVDALVAGDRASAIRYGLESCIDCGLCSAVCPSGLSLHPLIRKA
jgi:ferredoxin